MKSVVRIILLLITNVIIIGCGDIRKDNSNSIPSVQEISRNLIKINEEGNKGNYFIYFLDNGFLIQAAANKGDSIIRCEASPHLETNSLSNNQKTKLENLGWIKPDIGEVNYWVMQPIDSEEEIGKLSQLFVETINTVYKSSSVDSIIIHLEK